MNQILESSDHRLLDLLANGGTVAVGVYYMILSEMLRLNVSTLAFHQWRRLLHICSMLDRSDALDPGRTEGYVSRIVTAKLLDWEFDPDPLCDEHSIRSEEMAAWLAKENRASEVGRNAANVRWGKTL